MIRDSEFNESAIGKFIQADSVGRNQYLNTFLGTLNSVNKNTYISIDAKWGSGKTVFMRQIEYLNYCDLDNLNAPSLDDNILSNFQDKYIVFYYNAWENDYHDDPLQSLLFSLIDRFYADNTHKTKVKALANQAVKSIAKEAVKTFTKGIVDLDKIIEVSSVNDLVGRIKDVNDRKQAISNIICKILPEDKKLLFIIDELDRCNPEFAMRLMEVSKHYYSADNIVFVFSTNNRQLVHTVKKYYGNDFDGYRYLDKLYDLILELPPIDLDKYFQNVLRVPNDSYWINIIPAAIAKHLGMTMREANRYNSLLSLVKGELTSRRLDNNHGVEALTLFVFIPLALALKIIDIEQYDRFIAGDGESILRRLYASVNVLERLSRNSPNSDQSAVDATIESYNLLIGTSRSSYDQSNHELMQAGEFFRNTLPLISSISTIDTLKDAN